MNNLGVIAMGLKCPIVHQGDDIKKIIIDAVENSGQTINDGDIIGITESVVARAQGNYCTIDDIADSVKEIFPDTKKLYLYEPIASRNRFSAILRGIARAMDSIVICWKNDYDEVGNKVNGVHQVTGIDYKELYTKICEEENCECSFSNDLPEDDLITINCMCHPTDKYLITLMDICADKSIWGVLGSNLCGDEKLKLFPNDCFNLVTEIHNYFWEKYQKNVEVLVYGDGCFKDPETSIWEFADPITCPGYTSKLSESPQETKLKYLAENHTDDEVKEMILKGNSSDMGTTPRKYKDLLASLCDLVSGSGDKGTPIIYIKNYFNKYTD